MAGATAVATEIKAAGGRALPLCVDVSRPDSVATGIAHAVEAFGGLDILVNNAGICPMSRLEETSLEEWNRVLAVNLTGAFLCAQAAWPHLRRSGHGRIINISSVAGRIGGLSVGAHYSASKAGLIGLTKSLARFMSADGITSNCIAPGTLLTPMTADWPAETHERLRLHIPLGRLGRPEDVSAVAVLLASDGGAFITGATIDVNGGMAMI
jgi:3-oxoacyl-[acyl-carrier protein] reductase